MAAKFDHSDIIMGIGNKAPQYPEGAPERMAQREDRIPSGVKQRKRFHLGRFLLGLLNRLFKMRG
ncbi:MAG: hypothetical protein ACI83D_000568 [Planctomycetota bacterium]|jgi:hypothetical protein